MQGTAKICLQGGLGDWEQEQERTFLYICPFVPLECINVFQSTLDQNLKIKNKTQKRDRREGWGLSGQYPPDKKAKASP